MGFVRSAALHLSHLLPQGSRRHLKWSLGLPDTGASLELLRRKGFAPKTAIDIGAYIGEWTTGFKSVWPDAAVMMVEAQAEKRPVLDAVMRNHPKVQLTTALLSDVAGKEYKFNVGESGSSMYDVLSSPNLKTVTLVSQTLADIVRGTPFEKPDMVKLDIQGAELAAMRGGLDVIKSAEVVMLESSLAEEFDGAPLFGEVVAFMGDLGFAVQDICTLWRNTPSQSMNELDVIFAKRSSQLFDRKHYHFKH